MSNKESIGSPYTSLLIKKTSTWLQNANAMCLEKAVVYARYEVLDNPPDRQNSKIKHTKISVSSSGDYKA